MAWTPNQYSLLVTAHNEFRPDSVYAEITSHPLHQAAERLINCIFWRQKFIAYVENNLNAASNNHTLSLSAKRLGIV